MTVVVRETFIEWLEKYEKLTNDLDSYEYDHEEKILGIALFVKDIALKANDLELLGLATKIELRQQETLDFIYNSEPFHDDSYSEYCTKALSVRQFCIDLFYKQNRYSIDMDVFLEQIEANKELLETVGYYKRLKNYASPDTALGRVYNTIKHYLCKDDFTDELTPEIVDKLVEAEIKEVHRRAYKHLAKEFEKAFSIS